jgi:putative endopeptidase
VKRTVSLLLFLSLFAAACSTAPAPQTTPQPAASTKPLIGEHGFDLAQLDRSVSPCDNFYDFATGTWRRTHPLPATETRFGRFDEVAQRNRAVERAILEEAAAVKNPPQGSNDQKLGDFYKSCMNETAIEAQGIAPIQPELARIDDVRDLASLNAEIARLQTRGFAPAFRFSGQADYKNSTMNIAVVGQGGLALPDRDYYLRDDEPFRSIRPQYVEHIARTFALAGENAADAAADAKRVMDIETRLATAQSTRVEDRNPENRYHVMPIADLARLAPAFDWTAFLHAADVDVARINVSQPKFLTAFSELLTSQPIEAWKAYLRWGVLRAMSPSLSRAFVDEDFRFNSGVLSGQTEQQERWRRCVRSASAQLGQMIGEEYVRRRFSPEAKRKADELIGNLIAALRSDIPTLSWMGPETKQAAIAKLDAFHRRIGYPDKWRSYENLEVGRDSYAANVMNARVFSFRRTVERIGKPDDPNEWGQFTPSTVNASYAPSRNDITFPAGILQPPFYDPNADDAYNYGGIGTVIGHEMTHGFDDTGAKFDPQGNLRNWWTPADLKNFEARATCIAQQYSEFHVAPGVDINGRLVLGEAIADLGGATIALAAYEKSLEGKPRQTLDGFTPEQRFFLGFAQVWGENIAAQEATKRALTDAHAQGPFRVNGTVANMPAFAKAFGCATNAKMVRPEEKRCSIW